MSTAAPPRRRGLLIAAGLLLSLGLLAGLVLTHLDALERVGSSVRWPFVAAALACALGSYAMVGLALREVLGLLGYALPAPVVFGIAMVSTTANYVISTAGLSGFAVKAHLLRKRHVPYGTTVMASVVSSVVLYLVLGVIIAQGLLYLLLRLHGTRIAVMEGLVGLAVLLATSVTLLVFVVHRELRGRLTRWLFHKVNRAAFSLSKSEIPPEDFAQFEAQLGEGLERIRQNKGRLTWTIAYTALDWCLALLCLHFAFAAVGVRLSVGHLSAGFTIGQAATLIPFLPGGLGAMEGSMAAVFEGLGVSWDAALVAVLLYRLAYYVVPGIFSVFVLLGLKLSEPSLKSGPLAL